MQYLFNKYLLSSFLELFNIYLEHHLGGCILMNSVGNLKLHTYLKYPNDSLSSNAQ